MNYLSISKNIFRFFRNIHSHVEYIHIATIIYNKGRTKCSPFVSDN